MPRTDYESWEKPDLIERIKQLEERKKYGLVWDEERTVEQFEVETRGKLPVLTEDKAKEIHTDEEGPTHILIEGDNYHALSVLNYTHEGRIDVIYIDPPYNTGNNDFIFNDNFVSREDAYRHSKWLSFMSKRIKNSKKLLKNTGILIISIDDNEVAQLKIICDEVFHEKNFIAILPTIINLKGNNDQFGFSGTHEYNLVYAKDKTQAMINEFELSDEELEDWEEDENGFYKRGANLKSTGVNAPRQKRPNLYYAIFITSENRLYVTDNDELPENRIGKGDTKILPITDGNEMTWRWEKKRIKRNGNQEIIIVKSGETYSLYKKQRPGIGDFPTKRPKSFFYKPEYSSGNGTALIKSLFGEKAFDNPKPIELIKDLLFLTSKKEGIILDFFAGSGTTGHAVIDLNQKDKGRRQFILCTNNENKIAEDICYPRISKAIQGYKNNKGIKVEGLGGNLRYFKTTFVPGEKTDSNKKLITERSVEMLCLKENTFDEIEKGNYWQIFSSKERYTAILFEPESIREFRLRIEQLEKPVSVYVFSLSDEIYVDAFAGLEEKVTLCAIPESILKVYRRIYQ